jgi:hypothetical protein
MDEYQEYIRLFGDLPFGMRPKFEDYQKQKSAQTARNVLSSELQKGNLEKAYTEGYEQLPLMDQLLYGVAPGTGEALATYEIPEFAKRGNIAAQEGRKLDAAGNYLVSGLNAMSMIPVVGKAAGLAGDVTRILGRGTRAKTSDDMGGGTPPTPPPPTSTPTAFETVLTAEDIRGINKYTSRPATTVLEESVVNNPKFKKLYPNPDKPYEIDNMLTLMGKYGGDNRNVKEQIDLYVSPELKAKGKVTTRELLKDIADNKPTFTEYKARYKEGLENYNQLDRSREMDYLYNSPFISRYDNPRTITEAMERKAPINYEHKSFYINPTKEGQTYNINNTTHPEVSQGFMPSRTASENKVFHSRQYTYDMDGKKVMVVAEGQSGAYKMFEKAEDVPFSFDDELDAAIRVTTDTINETQDLPLTESLYDLGLLNEADETLGTTVAGIMMRNEPISVRGSNSTTTDEFISKAKDFDFDKLNSERRQKLFTLKNEEIDNELLGKINVNFERGITQADITPELRRAYRSHLIDTNELNISALKKLVSEGKPTLENLNRFQLRKQELGEKLQESLTKELGVAKQIENYDPKKLPLFNEWFNVHMKTSLQDAANSGVDEVWFPINDYAVARQRGETLSTPEAVRIAEFESDGERIPIDFEAKMQPSRGASEMAIKYKKFTEKGLNAIERDYGVELKAKPFTDANNQEFYRIKLTNELKDALSTLKLNRGGLVTLMPLHYT